MVILLIEKYYICKIYSLGGFLLLNTKKLKSNESFFLESSGVRLLKFGILEQYSDVLVHCFTTRIGGVSTGGCTSLNLGFGRKDSRENVMENYKRVCGALNINLEDLVLSDQVHDNKVRVADERDRGKGILKESDIKEFDGLVTNNKNVALVTFYADCVPVFIFDKDKKAIGLSHSGWRGTVKEIARETVQKMKMEFSCRPDGLEVVIGPSIGSCCFEVGEEVVDAFKAALPWSEQFCIKGKEKWKIDLKGTIKQTLINIGVKEENINVSDICTRCNRDIFFSHRGDNGKTGSLAAIMQLK